MKKNKIYIKQWLDLKPYTKQSKTDLYYLGVCNEVQKTLHENYAFLLEMYLTKDEISIFSCFLVSYLEDIVSETNIWNAFLKKHQELYGKKLPFYDTHDYYDGEINEQDIRFLIWYFINASLEGKFISPKNAFIENISDSVMEIFDAEYEYAPENEILKSHYTLPDTDDYYEVLTFMSRIFTETYLFFPDTAQKFDEMVEEITSEPDENMAFYLRESHDIFNFSTYSKLLSLRANEWVSLVLGKGHPLYDDIAAISQRANGWFFYKGQNETYIDFEHIATGKKFKITKKSYADHDKLTEDANVYLGMVKWKDEWWFSGISSISYDVDIVIKQKQSIKAREELNFLEDKKEIKKTFGLMENAFLSYNKNSHIAFLPKEQVQGFVEDYFEYYKKSLKLSKKELQESEQRAKKDGFFEKELNFEMEFPEEIKTATVFFNPVAGIEIYNDVCSAFPMKENPFYREEMQDEEFFEIVYNEFFSKEFVYFCVENCRDKLDFFQNSKYNDDEFDFLLRFFKSGQYHTAPKIALTGRK